MQKSRIFTEIGTKSNWKLKDIIWPSPHPPPVRLMLRLQAYNQLIMICFRNMIWPGFNHFFSEINLKLNTWHFSFMIQCSHFLLLQTVQWSPQFCHCRYICVVHRNNKTNTIFLRNLSETQHLTLLSHNVALIFPLWPRQHTDHPNLAITDLVHKNTKFYRKPVSSTNNG